MKPKAIVFVFHHVSKFISSNFILIQCLIIFTDQLAITPDISIQAPPQRPNHLELGTHLNRSNNINNNHKSSMVSLLWMGFLLLRYFFSLVSVKCCLCECDCFAIVIFFFRFSNYSQMKWKIPVNRKTFHSWQFVWYLHFWCFL